MKARSIIWPKSWKSDQLEFFGLGAAAGTKLSENLRYSYEVRNWKTDFKAIYI